MRRLTGVVLYILWHSPGRKWPGLLFNLFQLTKANAWHLRTRHAGSMGEVDRNCNGFCFKQVAACLRLADLSGSPTNRQAFSSMAAHWSGIARDCDGKLHPWTQWCHNVECDVPFSAASSPFVAQFIVEIVPDTADHCIEAADAYS